jgi:hypothetical protein
VQFVERIDLVDGEVVSRKRVATLRHEDDGHVVGGIVDERYLVTGDRNKVFDLRTGSLLDGSPPSLGARRVPATGGKRKLPGVVSPDGTKSVYAGGDFVERTDSLEFQFVGRPPLVVRDEFRATVRSISSFSPTLPLLWIDNDTVLTQRSNGNLVTVSAGGSVKPFLQLPCAPEDGPHLGRNRSGKLVYGCGGENYFLDVERGRYEGIRNDLGNAFELDVVEGESVYYYRGEEIGREGLDAVSTKSHLAMLYGVAKGGVIDSAEIRTVKVWSAAKRGWTKITVDGWGADIVGWIGD